MNEAASTGLHGVHQVQTVTDLAIEEPSGGGLMLPEEFAIFAAKNRVVERCASARVPRVGVPEEFTTLWMQTRRDAVSPHLFWEMHHLA